MVERKNSKIDVLYKHKKRRIKQLKRVKVRETFDKMLQSGHKFHENSVKIIEDYLTHFETSLCDRPRVAIKLPTGQGKSLLSTLWINDKAVTIIMPSKSVLNYVENSYDYWINKKKVSGPLLCHLPCSDRGSNEGRTIFFDALVRGCVALKTRKMFFLSQCLGRPINTTEKNDFLNVQDLAKALPKLSMSNVPRPSENFAYNLMRKLFKGKKRCFLMFRHVTVPLKANS